jgi:HlyD family secretion protein/epimerase transport system membrane fusion protein
LQRTAAALNGQRGSLLTDISRSQQEIGDVRIKLAQLDEQRQTEAADGMRTAQAQLTETEPRLTAVRNTLRNTDVVAPVSGYVFNLTQFTEGGVATGGERLLDIVPLNSRMVIEARVSPNDISDVKMGMESRVTFSGYNARTTPPVDGTVTLVSADATTDEATKEPYYTVHIKVEPAELAKAPNVRLAPGMPAQVAIVTSSRTILDYLIGPLTESMRASMRER